MIVGDIKAFLKLDTKHFNAGLLSADKASKSFSKTQKVIWKGVQAAATAAMGAMVSAIGLGIKEAVKFEKQMAKVNTMLGKDSKVSLATFAKGISDAAKKFGQSTDTLSNGLYDILSASVPAEDAMRVLNDAAMAATAGFTDTSVAADALTTLMNAYGDATYDSATAADVLFATVKRGKLTFGELADQIGTVATLAAKGGVSMEELAAMIATMTRNGLDAANATTALRGLMMGLMKPTDDLTEALGGLNVKNDGLVAVMNKIKDLPVDTLSRLFPNVRALTAVVTAGQDLGSEIKIIHGIMQDGSPTREAYNKATQTMAFQWAQFKEQLKAVGRELGEKFMPMLPKVLATIKKVVDVIWKWKEAIAIAAISIKGIAVALNIAKVAMIAFGASSTAVLGPIGLVATAIGAVVGVIISLRAQQKKQNEESKEVYDERAKRSQWMKEHYDEEYKAGLKAAKSAQIAAAEEKQHAWEAKAAAEAEKKGISETLKARLVLMDQIKAAQAETEVLKLKEEDVLPALKKQKAAIQGLINLDIARHKAWGKYEDWTDSQKKIIEHEIEWRDRVNEQIEAEKERLKVTKETTTATDDATEAQGKYADAYRDGMRLMIEIARKKAEEEKKAEKERSKARMAAFSEEKALNDKLRVEFEKLQQSETQIKLDALKKQADEYKKAGVDENKVDQWVAKEQKRILDEADTLRNRRIKALEDAFGDLKKTGIDTFTGAMMDSMEKFGYALGKSKDATKSAESAVKDFAVTLLEALPQIMLGVGVQLLAGPEWPVGLALIVLSGIGAAIVGAIKGNEAMKAEQAQITATETAQAEAAAEEKRKRKERLQEQLQYDLLSDRDKAIYDMNQQIKEFRDAGVSENAIALWKANQMETIDERYPAAGMQYGGVVEGPAGLDSTIIRATPGEYVMPVEQAQANLEILEAIRAGGSPTLSVEPVPVELTIDGRSVGRAVIEFLGEESDLGAVRLNSRVVRETE